MDLRQMPLFVWMMLINSFLVLAAFPSLNAALVMLLLDRQLHAHFFMAQLFCGSIFFGFSGILKFIS
jgi:heme/copper-type cytochrome/quinol oxidase subunit 1